MFIWNYTSIRKSRVRNYAIKIVFIQGHEYFFTFQANEIFNWACGHPPLESAHYTLTLSDIEQMQFVLLFDDFDPKEI